jgi:chaperonin GroEL (HSP60 family)
MTKKSKKFSFDAGMLIVLGVDIFLLAVAKTLGPRGRNVVIVQGSHRTR